LLVDVKLVGEVGHGNSLCNAIRPRLSSPSSYLAIWIGAVPRVTRKLRPVRRLRAHAPLTPTSLAIFTAMRRALFCRALILIWMTTVMQGDSQRQQ
jgi:hypothetical protein